jgi:hypothetical protein
LLTLNSATRLLIPTIPSRRRSFPRRAPRSVAPSHVPLRSASGPFAYSREGGTLYGQCTPDLDRNTQVAVCRIELKTGLTSPLPGSIGPYAWDIAVSPKGDCILISGLHRGDKDARGLFQLRLPSGEVSTILLENQEPPGSAWSHLSLAADAKRAVGTHYGRVEIIDLVKRRAEPLDQGLFIAEWSPNGKWLAVVEKGEGGRTILMDAMTLQQERTFGPSELRWSPDSRYLLGLKTCDSYYGTVELVEVASGARITLVSSACQVNQANTGWVKSDITAR